MSICIHEGLPGCGKTLRIMSLIEEFLKDGRPVYVFNLKITEAGLLHFNVLAEKHNTAFHVRPDRPSDLHVPLEVDTDIGYISLKCLGIENGATLIFDEGQEFFRSRGMSKEPTPPLVSMLPTHRHCGYNFHFLTQNAMFLDIEIRRLCDSYVKYARSLNLGYCKLAFYSRVSENPIEQRQSHLQDTRFIYPKHLFGLYVSSVDHNMKRRVPPKLKLLVFLLFFLIPALLFAIYYLWNSFYTSVSTLGRSDALVSQSLPNKDSSIKSSGDLQETKDAKNSKDSKAAASPKVVTTPNHSPRAQSASPSGQSDLVPLGKNRPFVHGLEGYILTYSGYSQIGGKYYPVISMQRMGGDGSCTYLTSEFIDALSLSIRYGDGFVLLTNDKNRSRHFLPLEASPCVNTYALANSSGSSDYGYSNVSSSSGNNSQSSQSKQSSPRPKPEFPRYHPSVMPGSPVNNSVVPDKLSPYEVPQNPDLK